MYLFNRFQFNYLIDLNNSSYQKLFYLIHSNLTLDPLANLKRVNSSRIRKELFTNPHFELFEFRRVDSTRFSRNKTSVFVLRGKQSRKLLENGEFRGKRHATGRGRCAVVIGQRTVKDSNPGTFLRLLRRSPVPPFLNVFGAIIAVPPKYR